MTIEIELDENGEDKLAVELENTEPYLYPLFSAWVLVCDRPDHKHRTVIGAWWCNWIRRIIWRLRRKK